ncbi:MAG: PmoA family protein [Planctomycetota bacterium]
MRRATFNLGLALLVTLVGGHAAFGDDASVAPANRVTIEKQDTRCRVLIGGELFTEYVFRGHEKPILYPVIGPHGIGMTRNYPMRTDVAGEADDHPHHKSLWFAHKPINDLDFWSTRSSAGRCVHDQLLEVQSGGARGVIRAANKWVHGDGKVIFTDTRTLGFKALGSARVIDWEITIEASQGPVTFGDSKEGTMAIRTHPNLRLENAPGRGVTTANGQAVTSEGVRGRDVWGKRADWIDYWGTINDKVVGIAIFDHPANPRHPTHWMARHYGYIGANPFGLNAFEGKPPGTGDMTIPTGEKVTFRYRFLFHQGDPRKAQIAQHYRDYAETGP